MAISRDEVLTQRQSRRTAKIAEQETIIDQFLVDFLDADTCVVDIPNTVPQSIFDQVVSNYRAVLWHVDVQSDFHNNRQLTFTFNSSS